MIKKFSFLLLKNRKTFLATMLVITAFMAYMASKVEITYTGSKVLPSTDSSLIYYDNFKKTFGEDGTVMVVGIASKQLFTQKTLSQWQALGQDIKKLKGVQSIVSIADAYEIEKDTVNKSFKLQRIFKDEIIDSENDALIIRDKLERLPFYQNLLYNKETGATLMAITFDNTKLNIAKRKALVDSIQLVAEKFEANNGTDVHFSGLPYIRTRVSQKISDEFKLFLGLAILVAAIILLVFFRSFNAVLYPILVVIVGVVWALGTMTLFGFNITLLTGLIPPLIVVIGIPNSVLIFNKYHNDYRKHGNKAKALLSVIQKIGLTTFIANVTTAIGFGVFYFTGSQILVEFGIIAALNIMLTYVSSLILIPIILSYLPAPQVKHTAHLDGGIIVAFIEKIQVLTTLKYRPIVYTTAGVLTVISIIGILKIERNGYVVDDLPKNDPVLVDLKFFEKSFNGILPFEVVIDTRKKNGVLSTGTLLKIEQLNELMAKYPEFSRSISINEVLKFSEQGFYNGNPNYYKLPSSMERGFILNYAARSKGSGNMLKNIVDSTKSVARITYQVADAGSYRMNEILKEITPQIDSIFKPDTYTTHVTGSSVMVVKGNNYLLKNLVESLILAIFLIAIIMFLLFRNFYMIAISILPNLIPLAITAGLMGFVGIPLKPSTILIFSIAFGLASDQTIYFLTKYRHELRKNTYSMAETVKLTLRETGVSMIYTAIILFCGFGIFMASSFGGSVSLGFLVAITMLVAVLFNLILLPTLIMTLDRYITRKAATLEPLIQVYDEDEDIDIEGLKIG